MHCCGDLALARQTGCHVQTHCSESDWAHDFVLSRYGSRIRPRWSDLDYCRGGHPRAWQFHRRPDVATILQAGAGIAHCPCRTCIFPMPYSRAPHVGPRRARGPRTDISGGASPSSWKTPAGVIASRARVGLDARLSRERRRSVDSRIKPRRHSGWQPRAAALRSISHRMFARLSIRCHRPRWPDANSNLHLEENATAEEILQKIVYHATRADIKEVWVANRRCTRGSIDGGVRVDGLQPAALGSGSRNEPQSSFWRGASTAPGSAQALPVLRDNFRANSAEIRRIIGVHRHAQAALEQTLHIVRFELVEHV